MGTEQGMEAVWGVAGGALLGLSKFRQDLDRDTRNARDRASNAQSTAAAALTGLNTLVGSGFFLRRLVHRVADFEVGQAYPGNEISLEPSAFATTLPSLTRPVLPEDLAVAPQQWPPSANPYDDTGKLEEPANALLGQNVATGLALGFAENRALLLGFPGATHPNREVLNQYYRFANGLGAALQATAGGPSPLTAQMYQSVFADLFAVDPAAPSAPAHGLLSTILADGAAATNSLAETVLATVTMPRGTLGVGQSAEVVFGELALGSANLRVRVRMETAMGPAVASTMTAISAQATLRQTVNVTRRADVSGNEIYEVIGESDAAVLDLVSASPNQDHIFVLTGTWSILANGNTVTAKLAQLRKL